MSYALADSKPGDILVFYLGLGDATLVLDYTAGGGSVDLPEPSQWDWPSWVREEGLDWRSAVQRWWGGRQEDIFRVRPADLSANDGRNAAITSTLSAINVILDDVALDTPWHTIDQQGINRSPGAMSYYEDHVHFPGMLSWITLEIMLSAYCPAAPAQ